MDRQAGSAGSARPARPARAERRGQLLDVAQRLFSTEGYHHVSMDEIAEHAHVTKPVLYRHFPSKLDLYLAIVDERGRDLMAAIDAAVPRVATGAPDDEGQEVVAAIVRAYLTFVDAAGEASTLLFESDVTHDPDVRARVESASRDAGARIAAVLAQVAHLPATDAETVAVALVALAQGAAVHRMRHRDTVDPGHAAELVARVARAGVASLVGPARAEPGRTTT